MFGLGGEAWPGIRIKDGGFRARLDEGRERDRGVVLRGVVHSPELLISRGLYTKCSTFLVRVSTRFAILRVTHFVLKSRIMSSPSCVDVKLLMSATTWRHLRPMAPTRSSTKHTQEPVMLVSLKCPVKRPSFE